MVDADAYFKSYTGIQEYIFMNPLEVSHVSLSLSRYSKKQKACPNHNSAIIKSVKESCMAFI
ncbi:MAG: hypothetical protein HC830_06925 [Bacteroidetes bacterium]|nr:hypothetical protein [Bacteroidota bacterium]